MAAFFCLCKIFPISKWNLKNPKQYAFLSLQKRWIHQKTQKILQKKIDCSLSWCLAQSQRKHFYLSSQRLQLFSCLNIPLLVGTRMPHLLTSLAEGCLFQVFSEPSIFRRDHVPFKILLLKSLRGVWESDMPFFRGLLPRAVSAKALLLLYCCCWGESWFLSLGHSSHSPHIYWTYTLIPLKIQVLFPASNLGI